jgi:hypothetical protein
LDRFRTNTPLAGCARKVRLSSANPPLIHFAPSLFAVSFACKSLFHAKFLAGLQVKGVPFDFPNDVLLQNLSLESSKGVL